MRRLLLGLVCLVGCTFQGGITNATSDAPKLDADLSVDPPFAISPPQAPTTSLDLTGGTIDTDNDCTGRGQVVTPVGGIELCVFSGTTVALTGTVTVIGARPFALFATGSMTIGGTLNASSTPNQKGAGANADSCIPGSAGTSNNGGGGGGAGGSFGTIGGDGGNAPGAGGKAGAASVPMFVRGGCAGRDGGVGNQNDGGTGGDGGGAVYLFAQGKLGISGTINASGAGGAGGQAGKNGGGGGGSGGMIALFGGSALTVTPTAQIFADGGGGGGGGDGTAGGSGGDPTVPSSAGVAGTAGTANGSAGGAGNLANGPGGPGVQSTKGAGGGGGGGGVVKIVSGQSISGNIAPPPT